MTKSASFPLNCLLWICRRCLKSALPSNISEHEQTRRHRINSPSALCCSRSLSWKWIFFPSQHTEASGWLRALCTLWWCEQACPVKRTEMGPNKGDLQFRGGVLSECFVVQNHVKIKGRIYTNISVVGLVIKLYSKLEILFGSWSWRPSAAKSELTSLKHYLGYLLSQCKTAGKHFNSNFFPVMTEQWGLRHVNLKAQIKVQRSESLEVQTSSHCKI